MRKIIYLLTLPLLIITSVFGQSCLMADYSFTGNANDSSGNGHHATVYGATLTADRFGNPNAAYEFDGVNDYINTFTTFDYQYRTVSFWFNADDISGTHPNDHQIVGQQANSLTYGSIGATMNSGDLVLSAGGSSGAHYNYSFITVNQWYHVVLVRDGATNKYYINGQLVGSAPSNGNGSISFQNDEFFIGSSRTHTDGFFDGVIDDIQIYNCALPDSSIQALYSPNPPCTVTVYDTVDVFDTTMVTVYDTTQLTILDTTDVFDTTNVTIYDTVITNVYDTITIQDTNTVTITDTSFITVYDTAVVAVYDTAIVYDTIWVTDTVYLEATSKIAGNPNQLKIYPNPTNGILNLSITDYTQLTGFGIRIFNALGQQVFEQEITSSFISVDLSQLGEAGVYLLQLIDANNQAIQTHKIVLE